jgi:hypothetical protein
MRSLNRRIQGNRPVGRRDAQGTVRIHDFGDEVHLWFEQRVPWPVALEVSSEGEDGRRVARDTAHAHPWDGAPT